MMSGRAIRKVIRKDTKTHVIDENEAYEYNHCPI